ncbi:MAG: carbohydrate ABC transporter permease [Firmicutes bacterium]|nr:carbohydrate ABC transporter permease [Bacillota bacterium]
MGKRRISRSTGGDLVILLMLVLGASFMALPMIFAISNAFKPLNELFLFPPRLFVRNPTLNNFRDLFILMAKSWVPMSRYIFNSLFIVVMGMIGNVFFASLAAYALSKHKFPGANVFMTMIVFSLMFAKEVTNIPNYITIAYLGMIDTYWAVIIPSWGSTLGLYLMKKFMDSMVDDSMIEASKIDGASEFRIFWNVVMPIVKPAWLTMIILVFQELWRTTGGNFIYAEHLKTLPYALNQIVAGGVARQGVGAATTLLMMVIPIIVFVFNQSKIVETMGTSGLAN